MYADGNIDGQGRLCVYLEHRNQEGHTQDHGTSTYSLGMNIKMSKGSFPNRSFYAPHNILCPEGIATHTGVNKNNDTPLNLDAF